MDSKMTTQSRRKSAQDHRSPKGGTQTLLGKSADGHLGLRLPSYPDQAFMSQRKYASDSAILALSSSEVRNEKFACSKQFTIPHCIDLSTSQSVPQTEHHDKAESARGTEARERETCQKLRRAPRVFFWDPRALHCLFHCSHTICGKIIKSNSRKGNRKDLVCNCARILECQKQRQTQLAQFKVVQQGDTTMGIRLNARKTPLEVRACANQDPDGEICVWFCDAVRFLADIQFSETLSKHYEPFKSALSTLCVADQQTALVESQELLFTDLSSYFSIMFLCVPRNGLPYRLVTPAVLKQEMTIFLRLFCVELLSKYFPSEATVSPGQEFEPKAFAMWLRESKPARELWLAWMAVIDEQIALCVWKHWRRFFKDVAYSGGLRKRCR